MALILLCGLPCSGKSTVARKLEELIKDEGREVQIVSDGEDLIGTLNESSSPDTISTEQKRAQLYKDSANEKKTRARLRAATERALNGSSVVMCDSLNYIKGYRYELFCVAKTSGTKYCVVYSETDPERAIEIDKRRSDNGEDAYGEEICRALTQRFEAPVGRNRWDSPLYRVKLSEDGWEDSLAAVKSFVLHNGKKLAATMATRTPDKQGADVLGNLDRLTREAEALLISELQGGKQKGERIALPNASKMISLERKPRVAELRNMRRSYLNLARMHPPKGRSDSSLLDEYIEFINAQLKVVR